MIGPLPELTKRISRCETVSKRKKAAIFEVAARLTLIAEKARNTGGSALVTAALTERRKALKLGLELVARGTDHERLDAAFDRATFMRLADPGERLEAAAVLAGIHALIAGDHPFIVMRRMTACLGVEFFDQTTIWLTTRIARRRRGKSDDLLVPGELPDILRDLAARKGELERAVRAAGLDLTAASLAGCPRESLLLAKPVFGRIGGAILEDNMGFLRSRLSSEEISGAQAAFLDDVHSLAVNEEISGARTDDDSTDPEFIRVLTEIVLDMDEKAIKAALLGIDGRLLAAAMQGMEPRAHERILAALGKREEKRILDSIDASDPLPKSAIAESGKELAGRFLASAERLGRLSAGLGEKIAGIIGRQ